MINFIVVEDNPLHLEKTKEIIISYMMKNDYPFDIKTFSKFSKELINTIKVGEHNTFIYILDFELPNTNAIDISRTIRNYDWKSPIIVFSVNGGMALETFKQRLQILDFVNKQYEAEKNLHELFDICFKQLKLRSHFKLTIKKKTYIVDLENILYLYRDNYKRKTVLVTDFGEHMINDTLENIKSKLNNKFIYSHKSYIINTKRVSVLDWKNNDVIFDNGVRANILSKSRRKELDCICLQSD